VRTKCSATACGESVTLGAALVPSLRRMGRQQKLLQKVCGGASDANIGFDELRSLLRSLGFSENVRGSHHIFRRPGVVELVNLQRSGSMAKAYQVRQVRRILLRYDLGAPLED
jgi:predicted RNA binding protein YcfA (HicA-like mRNA interferase family)